VRSSDAGRVFETATSGSVLRDANGAVIHIPTVEERALAARYAAWWLVHRMSSEYRTGAEISGPSGGPVEMTASINDVINALARAKRADERWAEDDE